MCFMVTWEFGSNDFDQVTGSYARFLLAEFYILCFSLFTQYLADRVPIRRILTKRLAETTVTVLPYSSA